MKQYLERQDRLVVLRAIESIIDKNLQLISLKEIVDMMGVSRYQFVIAGSTKTGGYETSVLIAPRAGFLFDKTVDEAEQLLSSKNKNKLRSIGWFLRDFPEFREFEELYPPIKSTDFGNEVVKPIDKVIKSIKVEEVDLYEGWEQTLHDNKYHVNHKRACRFVK